MPAALNGSADARLLFPTTVDARSGVARDPLSSLPGTTKFHFTRGDFSVLIAIIRAEGRERRMRLRGAALLAAGFAVALMTASASAQNAAPNGEAIAVAANNIIAEGLALQNAHKDVEAMTRFDAVIRMVTGTPFAHIAVAANFYAGRSAQSNGQKAEMERRYRLVVQMAPQSILGQAAAKALSVTTNPVPLPAVAACSRVGYMVFFDETGQLASQGPATLRSVVAKAAACPHTRLRIVGGADKSERLSSGGGAKDLAIARGKWVHDQLVALGLDSNRIIASGAIAVPLTEGDDAVEPQNRRVEILFE